MAASSTVVIKVKYGDVLRRFNSAVVDEKLFLNMDGLREKIVSLFSFTPDTDLMLTYVDEDGDVVALVDDDDLRDVVKQGLNPFRVTVKVNEKKGSQNCANASSTPLRAPPVQCLPNLTAGASEILEKVSEPLRETLLKLSDELAVKASLSSPSISVLVDNLSKVGSSLLGLQLSESGLNVQNGVPNSSSATDNKASEPLKDDPTSKLRKAKPAAKVEKKEVKIQNVTRVKEEGPSFDFSAVSKALEVQNVNTSKPESVCVSTTTRKKEKVKKTGGCSNGKSHAVKVAEFSAASSEFHSQVINKLTENSIFNSTKPKLGANSASDGSYHRRGLQGINGMTHDSERGLLSPYNFNYFGHGFFGRHPFLGTSENISGASSHWDHNGEPLERSDSQNDSSGRIFHLGVRCDGCGIHPIVGPRFMSKVKVDYDLCRVCHEKMGNGDDYVRLDRPAVSRHPVPPISPFIQPHVYRGSKNKIGAVKLDSRFIQDVNVFDGTVMAPLTPFTKIWRMRNNGTVAWPVKTQLVWIGGDKLTATDSVEVEIPAAGLPMEQELDVAVDFISPELPGRYISYWRMASPSGPKFGQRVWVLIQVDASNDDMPQDSMRNLNLNLPPASSTATGPEIISVDPEPVVEVPPPKTDNLKKVVELKQPKTENEMIFPISDSLLVGNDAGSSSAAPSSSSAPYPIIDLTDDVPTLPPVSPFSPYAIPAAFSMPLGPIPPSPFAFQHPFSIPPPGISLPRPKPQWGAPLTPHPSWMSMSRHPPPPVPVAPAPAPVAPAPAPVAPAPAPVAPTIAPVATATAPVATAPEPAAELPVKDLVEDKLLKELEEMGFKHVDLNKEILRLNEYNLEQAVDDLCGNAGWDPILEELEEMGFHDTEKNKKLLKKKNGSIKRVVMDLIAGEEA